MSAGFAEPSPKPLGVIAPRIAVVTAATADARQRMGIVADDRTPSPAAVAMVPAVCKTPKRHGLGTGFQNILMWLRA